MYRGIFQGELLSPLLLITILIPLSMTLNSTNYRYLLLKETPLIIFYSWIIRSCMVKQSYYNYRVHTIWVISKNIGMESGIDKCSTVCIKKGKICDMEDIEMPNGQRVKNIKENGYKYLGIIQNILHKLQKMKFSI